MAIAYEENTSPDIAARLLAALLAGDDAGGDHCGRLAAGLRLARSPDHGSEVFALDVDESSSAVVELVALYDAR